MRSLKYDIVIIPYRCDSLFHGLYHIIVHKMIKTFQSNYSTATRCSALVLKILTSSIIDY